MHKFIDDIAASIDKSGFKKAERAVEILLWPYNYSEKEVRKARTDLDAVSKNQGILTITDAKISSGPDGRDTIEELYFQVELK